MRTFVCEFWEILCIIATVSGITGIVFRRALGELFGWLIGTVVVVLIICGVTYNGSLKVDNVVGMDKNNAVQTLQESGLKVNVNENSSYNVIQTQSISADNWVKKGTEIFLNYEDIPPTPTPESEPDPPTPTPSPEPPTPEPTDNITKITTNEFAGRFNNNSLEHKYSFTPSVSGKHRFDFDIDNVNNNYKFSIHDSKGNVLKNTNCRSKGTTVELTANNTYFITITKDEGNPEYTIFIGSPQSTKNVSNNQLVGSIKYIDQMDTYTYTAPTTGIYGLKFEINDVQKYYKYSIYDSKNQRIKSGDSNIRETSTELQAGQKYTINIMHYEGFVDYKVSLGVPNEIFYLYDNNISGGITYHDQENCYIYTPSYTGKHTIKMSIDDVKKIYKVKIVDDVNATVRSTNSASKESTAELSAGKQYKIYVSYYEGICNYSINIS